MGIARALRTAVASEEQTVDPGCEDIAHGILDAGQGNIPEKVVGYLLNVLGEERLKRLLAETALVNTRRSLDDPFDGRLGLP